MYIFWIKQILLLGLLYEEVSFLTKNSYIFVSFINKQNEFNIHNANFWGHVFYKLYIFPQDSINISFGLIVSMLTPLIWGFGSYIKILKNFRYIILEKSYSFFCLIYPTYIIISYFNRNIFLESSKYIVKQEAVELTLYLLLLFDLREKIKFYKLSNKKNI